jgi:hypothetical protein
MEFTSFPKIPRFKREVTITEKIDGSNAQIMISRLAAEQDYDSPETVASSSDGALLMRVGSRSRWITPGKATDNFGFAGWCVEHAEELFKLGEGQHFGEWYGSGIQRTYGLGHKRFALFNTARWGAHNPNTPACCEVVPVLYRGPISSIETVLAALRYAGSNAVPGFMAPEGIIVYHSASRSMFKVLLENDDTPKGKSE